MATVRTINLFLSRVGSDDSYDVELNLRGDSVILATATKSASDITTEPSWVSFRFDPAINTATYTVVDFTLSQSVDSATDFVICYGQSSGDFNASVSIGATYADESSNNVPQCPGPELPVALEYLSAVNEDAAFDTDNINLDASTPFSENIKLNPHFVQQIHNDVTKCIYATKDSADKADIGIKLTAISIASFNDMTALAACLDGIYITEDSAGTWRKISSTIATAIATDGSRIAVGKSDSKYYVYDSIADLETGTSSSSSAALSGNIERLRIDASHIIAAVDGGIYIDGVSKYSGDFDCWAIDINKDIVVAATAQGLWVYEIAGDTSYFLLSGVDIKGVSLGAELYVVQNNTVSKYALPISSAATPTDTQAAGAPGKKTAMYHSDSGIWLGTDSGLFFSKDNGVSFSRLGNIYEYTFSIAAMGDGVVANTLFFGNSQYLYEFTLDASGSQPATIHESAEALASAILARADKCFLETAARPNSIYQPVPDHKIKCNIIYEYINNTGTDISTSLTGGAIELRNAVANGYFALGAPQKYVGYNGSKQTSKDTDNYYRTILISDSDGSAKFYIDGAAEPCGFPVESNIEHIVGMLLPVFAKSLSWHYEFQSPVSAGDLTNVDIFYAGSTAAHVSSNVFVDAYMVIDSGNFPFVIDRKISKRINIDSVFHCTCPMDDVLVTAPSLEITQYGSHKIALKNIDLSQAVAFHWTFTGSADEAYLDYGRSDGYNIVTDATPSPVIIVAGDSAYSLSTASITWLKEESTQDARPGLPELTSTGTDAISLQLGSTIDGSEDIAVSGSVATIKVSYVAVESVASGTSITVDFGLGSQGEWKAVPSNLLDTQGDGVFVTKAILSGGSVITFSNQALLSIDELSLTAEEITRYPDSGSPQVVSGEASIVVGENTVSAPWTSGLSRGLASYVFASGAMMQKSGSVVLNIIPCSQYGVLSMGGGETIDITVQNGQTIANATVALAESDKGVKSVIIPVATDGVYRVTAQGYSTFSHSVFVGESPVGVNAYWGDPFAYDGPDFAQNNSALDWIALPIAKIPQKYDTSKINILPRENILTKDNEYISVVGSIPSDNINVADISLEELITYLKYSQGIGVVRNPAHRERGIDWSEANLDTVIAAEIYSFHGSSEKQGLTGPIAMTNTAPGHFITDAFVASNDVVFFAGSGDVNKQPGLMGANLPEGRSLGLPPVNNRGLTCVFSQSKTTSNLLSAMKRGATTATTGAKIFAYIWVAGYTMGEFFIVSKTDSGLSKTINLELHCEPTVGTAQVEWVLVKQGDGYESILTGSVLRGAGKINMGNIDEAVISRGKGQYAIYAKITQSDGHIAWVSPVYFEHT